MNTHNSLLPARQTILSRPLRRPCINSLNGQRVVFILDRSGSMADGTKAQDARLACHGALAELALPINKDAFEAAVIEFNERVHLVQDFIKATVLVAHADFLREDDVDGGTNITDGLLLADQLLQQAAALPAAHGVRYIRPFAVLMSDGEHNCGHHPGAAADALKQNCDVLTVAFGDDADEKTLRSIASDHLCVRCRTGAELRRYFAEVGRTLTVTRAAGQSAVTALTYQQS